MQAFLDFSVRHLPIKCDIARVRPSIRRSHVKAAINLSKSCNVPDVNTYTLLLNIFSPLL
jgi:hypothetical protein